MELTNNEIASEIVKKKYYRRSTRLKGYDYSFPGAYFVTICARNRQELFGTIINENMVLSKIGFAAQNCWTDLPTHFSDIELDEFVVMPNHIHGIVVILDNLKEQNVAKRRGVQLNAPTSNFQAFNIESHTPTNNYYSQISPVKKTLGVIIRTYKAAVTSWCRKNDFDWFQWQRNYHDHIIRNEKSLNHVREYIATNPQRWQLDSENLLRTGNDDFDQYLISLSKDTA